MPERTSDNCPLCGDLAHDPGQSQRSNCGESDVSIVTDWNSTNHENEDSDDAPVVLKPPLAGL